MYTDEREGKDCMRHLVNISNNIKRAHQSKCRHSALSVIDQPDRLMSNVAIEPLLFQQQHILTIQDSHSRPCILASMRLHLRSLEPRRGYQMARDGMQ